MAQTKVNLDQAAAHAVHQTALRENRSASNAASTMILSEWRRREAARSARTSPETEGENCHGR